MNKQYRYSLQKGSAKSICPECNKKTFVRYVDSVTGDCLPERFGRCDREVNCGYHLKPEHEKPLISETRYTPPAPKPRPVAIPFEVLGATLTDYEQNVFIQNLLNRVSFPFDPCDVEAVISAYYLGTVAKGAVCFPFIDIQNNIRAIQVKRFDETNHTTKTTFLHSIIEYQHQQKGEPLPDWLKAYQQNELKISCLFGEHLLSKYPLNPVALVEAPKSAIYGSLYFGLPDVPERFLWLAVYNLSSLNVAKCQALQGREVVLFPDLSKDGKAFELWSSKLKELNTIKGARFRISDLLERKASEAERANGCDIADYLICQDWRLFRESVESVKSELETKHFFCHPQTIIEQTQPEKRQPPSGQNAKGFLSLPQQSKRAIYRPPAPTTWAKEIEELETYFSKMDLPTDPVQLNPASTIISVPLFIESHLMAVKANNGKYTFLPYLNRLQTLKQLLKK